MRIGQYQEVDLSYCSNIFRGEDWETIFNNLKCHLPSLKASLAPHDSFGIGLRLSNQSVDSLMKPKALEQFKHWLVDNDFYVTTVNAFPYGNFHGTCVKERVYAPDWTTTQRRDYSLHVMNILAYLTPSGGECGFSTVPLSYKHWFSQKQKAPAFRQCILHISQLAVAMANVFEKTQRFIHMDIEPEPDCLVENMNQFIDFYEKKLIPEATRLVADLKKISTSQAEALLRRHIQVCYDICHSSVAFEKPADIFSKLSRADIGIGKIQVSSALKCNNEQALEHLHQFVDPVYLHQVTEHHADNTLTHKNDLVQKQCMEQDIDELRVHFHVPIFVEHYGLLDSTQSDIVEILNLVKKNKLTKHLEIETYTWEVLPADLQLDLLASMEREYRWVINQF